MALIAFQVCLQMPYHVLDVLVLCCLTLTMVAHLWALLIYVSARVIFEVTKVRGQSFLTLLLPITSGIIVRAYD